MSAANVPGRMRVVVVDRFGPPSVLKMHTLPVPKPGPSDVLVRTHAIGIGSWDRDNRDGSWRPVQTKPPLVIGMDGSGVVVAKGSRVRRFRIGDRVYASQYISRKGGFYAEYVAVDQDHLARIPPRLDFLQAAGAASTGLTALQGIEDKLHLRREQTILIFGASGGVGTLAVQFAKALGARVLAVASGRKGVALVRRLGADAAVNGRDEGAIERLWQLAPNGVDAVLACAGGEALERCLDLLRPGGRVAFPNGAAEPRRRRANRRIGYDLVQTSRWFNELDRVIRRGQVRVPIAAVFPFARAADAHRRLEKGGIPGRMALRVRANKTSRQAA